MVDLVPELVQEFQKTVRSLFREEVIFSFICGSLARGESGKSSDIDIFIAVNSLNNDSLDQFRKWYIDFHSRFGFVADREYPGEVVLINDLDNALDVVERRVPVRGISEKQEYDGIIWAGMLIGETMGFMGNDEVFKKFRNRAELVCKKWNQALVKIEPQELGLDVVLRDVIIFQPLWKKK